jgi:hypothetical protein
MSALTKTVSTLRRSGAPQHEAIQLPPPASGELQENTMTKIHNNNCDGARCTSPNGEVRVYPLGGGGNLILCQSCWAHENQYRFNRGKETGEPSNFPQQDWYRAEIYKN